MTFRIRAAACAVCCAAAGCVTTEYTPEAGSLPISGPVTIPLSGGDYRPSDPVTQYFESVLLQMHDAVLERDPERLLELCATHERSRPPAPVLEKIQQFRRIASVLVFERTLERTATIELRGEAPAIGELVPFELRVPAVSGPSIELGGNTPSTRASFQVRIEVEDFDCFGGSVERGFSDLVVLGRSVDVGAEPVVVPFDLAALEPQGILRKIRISAAMLPGHVRLDDEVLPVQRVDLAKREFELFPRGVELVHGAPLKTLRNALRSRNRRHLEHAFLAARAMPALDQPEAASLLVEQVRVGDAARMRASMAALREMTGLAIAVDDRDGWLRWWAERQSEQR